MTRTEIHYTTRQCSLGMALVATTDVGVCTIFLGDEPEPLVEDLKRRFPSAEFTEGIPGQKLTKVIAAIESPGDTLELPVDIRGTSFQVKVWNALRKIPAGKTSTYTEIAKRIGLPMSVRAVANACGANPLAVVVPCHRVLRKDRSLSGYRWGVERKAELLKREARIKSLCG